MNLMQKLFDRLGKNFPGGLSGLLFLQEGIVLGLRWKAAWFDWFGRDWLKVTGQWLHLANSSGLASLKHSVRTGS